MTFAVANLSSVNDPIFSPTNAGSLKLRADRPSCAKLLHPEAVSQSARSSFWPRHARSDDFPLPTVVPQQATTQ